MIFKSAFALLLIDIDFTLSADTFNYRSTSGRDFGPADWDKVRCNDLDTCPGWPDKLEGSIGWTLTENTCKSCPIEGNSCGQHRQSPIDLQRDRAIAGHENEKECPDWHWMQFKDGSCRFDDMLDQFEISRHALQIHTPIRSNGDIDCVNEVGERNFPKLDYSKGFPDWWLLSRTDISVPSEHVQHGKRYAAEVVLSHFYEIDHYKNKLGKISIFMQDFEDEPAWHYLDKLICQWRKVEEEKRRACGLPPAPVYKMCELYRGQERTEDDFEVPTESANNYPTRTPLVAPPAIPIQNLGPDPDGPLVPMQLCQGDCDFTTDCAEGLVCFRRDAYESVPGCIGGETDDTETDYCVFDPYGDGYFVPTEAPTIAPTITARPSLAPLPPKHLTDYGGTPPADKFPLQLCEGDCDHDDHCAEGLICFQRDENDPVPGCIGGDKDIQKTDYCILDPYGPGYVPPPTPRPTGQPSSSPTKRPTSHPTANPSAHPTRAPQLTSVPTKAPQVTSTPTSTPTSSPTEEPTSYPTASPTAAPHPEGYLKTVNNLGWEPPTPLGECQGDCDTDSDCGEGMFCYQRNAALAPVPGCAGGENDYTLTDYCTYGDTTSTKRPTKAPTAPPTRAPTARPTKAPTARPTKAPTARPTSAPTKKPSPAPTSSPTKAGALRVNNIGWSPPTPLAECYGDCDHDNDCMDGMVCYQRNVPYMPVPGCIGGEQDSLLTDYCILESNMPKPPTEAPITDSPSAEPTSTPTKGPTVNIPTEVEPIPLNNRGWSPPTPMGRCEGDCDVDTDCAGSMICYQRYVPYKAVPGCIGGETDPTLTDYCIIDPETIMAASAPVTPAPVTHSPVTLAPVTSSPITSAPITSAPVTSAPVTPAPVTSAPVTPAPVTPAPVTPAPVTSAPVTPAPVTSAPVTSAPVTSAPVTSAPVTPAPVAPAPVTSAPAASQVAADSSPPLINCDDYPGANFFRMCKDNSCCRNPRSTSEFCEETYALLGNAVESACHYCCLEERGIAFDVGPGPDAPVRVDPEPVPAIPPSIDCDAYDANYFRMCKDNSCCQNPRSESQFCHETYLILGDAVESACHHCCMEERGVSLEVGPAPVPEPSIPMTVDCSDERLNSARMCRANSCCDGNNLNSGFCAETLALFPNSRNALDSICWYCCHPSKHPDHRLLGEIASPEVSASSLSGASQLLSESTTTTLLAEEVASAVSKEAVDKNYYNDTIRENDVVTHDVDGRRIIVRAENFEPKGLDDEEEYFEKIYGEYQKRKLQVVTPAENYDDVLWWPYEWLLKVETEYYFRYEGTQTVPPCYETAHWRVMKDPIRVAPHQMRELERLIAWRIGDTNTCQVDTAGKPRAGNPDAVDVNRPLQGTHKLHRMVFCECQDWPSKFQQDRNWCRHWRTNDPEDRLFERPYNFRSDGFDFLN